MRRQLLCLMSEPDKNPSKKTCIKTLHIKKTFVTLHSQKRKSLCKPDWKGAGVVDRGGLENRCTLAGTQGSNPCLSAVINEAPL